MFTHPIEYNFFVSSLISICNLLLYTPTYTSSSLSLHSFSLSLSHIYLVESRFKFLFKGIILKPRVKYNIYILRHNAYIYIYIAGDSFFRYIQLSWYHRISDRSRMMKMKKRVLVAVAALCLFFIVFQISVSSTSRFLNNAAFPAKSTQGTYIWRESFSINSS